MKSVAMLRAAAATTALAAVLLFGAAARMRTMGDGWAVDANQAIERYAFADRSLTRDMLSARIGLLRNYDMINQDLASADESIERLVQLAGDDLPLRDAVSRLGDHTRSAEAMAEEFKSENALLQNSLARVTALCNLLQDSPRAGTVSARFLRLTLDTSPAAVAAAQAALAGVKGARSDLESQLITHGSLLIALLPRVDAILDAVREGSRDGEIEIVRRLTVEHQQRIEAGHQRAFLGLLAAGAAAGILWLALLAALRAQSRERRRRRENERLSATVASLLLEVSSEQLEQRIGDALQRLAAHAGATDAYLVLQGEQAGRTYVWSSDGRLSENWPARVAAAAQDSPLWEEDVLHLALPHGADTPLGAMLLSRGTTSLLLLRASTPVPALLGFERHDTDRGRSDVIAGLHMAQAAILQALRRDGLERARLQLELRLARARRMEAIGAVASGVAHNFNNIIGAIGGFSEIAEIHAGQNRVVREDLSEIRQAVDRARELVDEILAFGRGHDAEYRPLALQALVEETVRLVQATGRGTVCFAAQDWPVGREVQGNATQLQQVFMNICNNAFLAMPGDPHVDVTLGFRVECRPRAFSHGSLEAGDYAVVTIADRGCGIAAAAQPRLFEPFFTGRQGGTGLGLSTAWEIVQAHGGTIDVRSAPGQGSRFDIWLPAMRAQLQAPVQQAAAPLSGNGEGVLVVAPAAIREAVEDLVAQLGYEPVSVDPARADLAEQADHAGADAVLLVDAPGAAHQFLPDGRSGSEHGMLLLMRPASGQAFAPVPLAAPLDPIALAAALHPLTGAPTLQP
ncbi:signal transduction histidine kinase [Sphingomonas trueperi]|uniref:DAHL domain-containing protein n=1 Tax=Sphingomonas trueperi TaxID=53317 RepID=UPI003397295D